MANKISIPPTIKPEEKAYLENCGIIFGDIVSGYYKGRESYKIDLPENWTAKIAYSSTDYTEVFNEEGVKVFDTNEKSTSYDYFFTFDFNRSLLPTEVTEVKSEKNGNVENKSFRWNGKIW